MRILEIRRYPVKSMGGEQPPEVAVGPSGLAGDRAHALIDQETGKVASAKRPRLWAGLLGLSASYVDEPVGGAPVSVRMADGTVVRSDEAGFDDRLSAAVGRPVRMTSTPPEDAGYEDEWPDVEGMAPADFIAKTQTATSEDGRPVSTLTVGMMAPGTFQDLAPITLLTTATLRAAERLQPESRWDPRRFRANLLIDADGAEFVENGWAGRQIRIGDVVLEGSFPIPRCVMTTLPQDDLPADREILRTVARENRVDIPGLGRFACLGSYAVVVQGGRIATGDSVELL